MELKQFLITYTCWILLSLFPYTIIAQEESTDLLVIEVPVVAVQVGESASFSCSNTSEIKSDIIWLYQNETVIPSTRENATIVTVNKYKVESTDHEEIRYFTCSTIDREFNATAELKIYMMPSYFTQAMIVVGINAALVVVFLLCFVFHTVKNRKTLKHGL